MANETQALAKFAANLRYEDIPAEVRGRAIDLLVDQIGVEIGCSELPWAKQVRDTYCRSRGIPEATVLRYGDRLPVGAAAFINATFGHSFEYDDGNPRFHGHPGAELVPSLMAVAEHHHISGRDFLTALIAGYEVRGRIGWALSPDMVLRGGPQYSTTCGPFGVAAGVSRLLGLGAVGIRNALGIAGGFCGGLMQYDVGGGSVKRVYTAIAANNGIQSALLAQNGITGPDEILEGARGLLRIYGSAYRVERLNADFGTKWMFETMYFKAYSCVGVIGAAIDALRKIVTSHSLKPDDIKLVRVGYASFYRHHAGVSAPRDLLEMQFSTSYSLAISMIKGRNTPLDYTNETLANSEIRAFADRVLVQEDAELNKCFEGHLPARVEVATRKGDVYEEVVMDAKGTAGAPLNREEIDNKFRSQVEDVFGLDRCKELVRVIRNIDTLDDMAKLPSMLVKS